MGEVSCFFTFLARIAGDDGGEPKELVGLASVDGAIFLVDSDAGIVFDSKSDERGRKVRIGRWDGTKRELVRPDGTRVVLGSEQPSKQSATPSAAPAAAAVASGVPDEAAASSKNAAVVDRGPRMSKSARKKLKVDQPTAVAAKPIRVAAPAAPAPAVSKRSAAADAAAARKKHKQKQQKSKQSK